MGDSPKKILATHFRFVKRKFSSFHMSDFFEALTDWLLPWIGGCFPISPDLPWYSECFRARCWILTSWFLVPRLDYPFKIKHRNGKSISYSCVLPFKSWFISVSWGYHISNVGISSHLNSGCSACPGSQGFATNGVGVVDSHGLTAAPSSQKWHEKAMAMERNKGKW